MVSQRTYPPGETAALEALANNAYEQDAVTEVIRPAAVLPESVARAVLAELALNDARSDGVWIADPTCWRRYSRSWNGPGDTSGDSVLLGTMQVAYGTPRRYEITVYRATITRAGSAAGWSVAALCDEAFGYGGCTLAACPRAELTPPPRPFRMP